MPSGRRLVELGRQYPKMIVLDADLHTSSKATAFKKAYPERFIQVGIAEQNLFGIAAGLALSGFMPFPSTFAVFATRRALDQIAISICFPNLNVKIPGSYVGLPTSRAGASHNCIEDIAVMRALPNMRVADPADAADLRGDHARGGGGPRPRLLPDCAPRPADDLRRRNTVSNGARAWCCAPGSDVTLFGTGMMTTFCLEAAELLAAGGRRGRGRPPGLDQADRP